MRANLRTIEIQGEHQVGVKHQIFKCLDTKMNGLESRSLRLTKLQIMRTVNDGDVCFYNNHIVYVAIAVVGETGASGKMVSGAVVSEVNRSGVRSSFFSEQIWGQVFILQCLSRMKI